MKRLMILLAIVCSSLQMFASELIVKGEIDAPFSVFINGQKYYSYNHKVTISSIPKGYYNLQIYTEGSSYELLYDCNITIQRNAKVTATFTGDNHIYVYTNAVTTPVIVEVMPYPHRPVIHSEPRNVYYSKPKKAPHYAAPAPAPRPAPKPAPVKSVEKPKSSVSSSSSSSRSKSTPSAAKTSRSTPETRK